MAVNNSAFNLQYFDDLDSNSRPVGIQRQTFEVQREMGVCAVRYRHLRVRSRSRREPRLGLPHAVCVEPTGLHALSLRIEKGVLILDFQCLLGLCEAQRRRAIVWVEHKVDLVLPALVVDCPVAKRTLPILQL